ncbi:alpha,alpha-trehalase [Roseiarcus fermentans]|uniref:Alpha,alpha-trehalase n=1 Tax=Roseiarcus fermentans TaxID=1473586 RepID=A0A366FT22_9HYPH|nr:alpha,alpha-trehalase TreF [Roseiarcus fermentans]RBP17727.1 alpha,alpha-trehalase [Roseiarcus fermentans]
MRVRRFPSARALALLLLLLSPEARADAFSTAWPAPPSIAFGDLYSAVEMSGLFADQKTFADAIPKEPPHDILAAWEREKALPDFDLRAFVDRHFSPPTRHLVAFTPRPDEGVRAYIRDTWDTLTRTPDVAEPFSSLLPLPRPYVVPGGRFSEIYYWDSYFVMLGLIEDGRADLARDMLDNIASLIARYGHMPNGNRSYYLSRSQPPFFSLMVELLAAHEGDAVFVRYLPQLQAEYDYWMDGADTLAPGSAARHVVRLADGTLFNRYWDDRAAPRDESYREDVETAKRSGRPAQDVYRDLRAGAESGWDFGSRWLADGRTLSTIRTTDIVPVDLNAAMGHLEATLATAWRLKGDPEAARRRRADADQRSEAIRRLLWNGRDGFFADYLWREGRLSDALTAATAAPLAFRIAAPEQAHAVADTIRKRLLGAGGLDTTLTETGQQWDRPNGWAPIQYLAVEGLRVYGEPDLAREIARRWIATNVASYAALGVLAEKYDVDRPPAAGAAVGRGGEYGLQVGFGWTNGVLAALMADYPDLAAEAERRNP